MEVVSLFVDHTKTLAQLKVLHGVKLLHSAVVYAPDYVEELVYLFPEHEFFEGDPSPLVRAVQLDRARFVSVVISHHLIPAWRVSFLMKEAVSTDMIDALMEARNVSGFDYNALIPHWGMQGRGDLAIHYLGIRGAEYDFFPHEIEEWPFHAELMARLLVDWGRVDIHELIKRILDQIRANADHDRRLLVVCLKHINNTGGYKDTMVEAQEDILGLPQPDEVLDEIFNHNIRNLYPLYIREMIIGCHKDNLPRALKCKLFGGHEGGVTTFKSMVSNNSRIINFVLAMPALYQNTELYDHIEERYAKELVSEGARMWSDEKMEMFSLYLNKPHEARLRAERNLGLVNKSANALALTVYLCDDHLVINKKAEGKRCDRARQFFSIARRLPLDIQHVLCSIVGHYPKELISHADLETALVQNATHYNKK